MVNEKFCNTADGKDGGIGNTKRGDMSHRPHVGFENEGFVTESRTRRATELAFDYHTHDFRGSPCLTASAAFFGVRKLLHFMHYSTDFVRAVRKGGYTIRSRSTVLRRAEYSVSDYVSFVTGEMSQTAIKQLSIDGEMPDYFAFIVEKHIFVTDFYGKVMIDTAPHDGEKDNRKVLQVYGVWG